MDTVISELITNLPNLAIAVWSLWWSFRRLEQMLEVHERFVERLLTLLAAETTRELRAVVEDALN